MSKEENKKLYEEFPFLIPVNVWSGKRIIDCCGPNGENGYWPFEYYGEWLAYRAKPERSEG